MKIDLGCGPNKPAGYFGLDSFKWDCVDMICDLREGIPFEDSTVDELRAHDFIEHLEDKMKTMNEIWRVCKNGALVDIYVPSTDGRGAFQDPTHVSYWNINSFYYYTRGHFCREVLGESYGVKARFDVVELYTTPMSHDQVCHVVAKLRVVK